MWGNVCRVCGHAGSFDIFEPLPLFLHDNHNDMHLWRDPLSVLLEKFTSMKLSKDDNLPNKICLFCLMFLKSVVRFNEQAVISVGRWQAMLRQGTEAIFGPLTEDPIGNNQTIQVENREEPPAEDQAVDDISDILQKACMIIQKNENWGVSNINVGAQNSNCPNLRKLGIEVPQSPSYGLPFASTSGLSRENPLPADSFGSNDFSSETKNGNLFPNCPNDEFDMQLKLADLRSELDHVSEMRQNDLISTSEYKWRIVSAITKANEWANAIILKENSPGNKTLTGNYDRELPHIKKRRRSEGEDVLPEEPTDYILPSERNCEEKPLNLIQSLESTSESSILTNNTNGDLPVEAALEENGSGLALYTEKCLWCDFSFRTRSAFEFHNKIYHDTSASYNFSEDRNEMQDLC